MVIVSKPLFDSVCKSLPCSQMGHPWTESCWRAYLDIYKSAFFGSAKFYSIVYLAQILLRGKKMAKMKEWQRMGEYYVRSTAFGFLVSTVGLQLMCLFRKLFGQFTLHSFGLLPYTLTGVFIYLEPPNRRGLVINLFCNLAIEYHLRLMQRAGYLSITKSKQVLMFMIGSSLLFYLMRLEGDKKERTPLFWFFTSEKVRIKSDDSSKVCPHEGDCKKYIFKSASMYFGIGLAVSLARLILPHIKNPVKAISSIRSKHIKLALFLSSYIGIYRAVICYLCRKHGVDSALYALPAGYAAGLSFLFKPDLGLAIASLTGAFKLYSTILYEKKILPSNIPLPEILFCWCQGTLCSARVIDPDVCPHYVFNLMNTISGGKINDVADNFQKIIKNAL